MQVSGDIFVIGDGDCGQLGRGEDVAEALRPAPSPIPDKKVWALVSRTTKRGWASNALVNPVPPCIGVGSQ